MSRYSPLKMGCISSKFATRTIGFRERQNQSLQRTANGMPVKDELNISCNGSDHYLALVSAANMVVNRLRSQDFNSNPCSKPTTEPGRNETSNTGELVTSLFQGEVKHAQPAPKETGSSDLELPRRSKSCHWFPEHDVSSLASDISVGIKEEESYLSYKGMVRNRSFHTVEEYDAMLETTRSSLQQTWLDGKDYPGTNMHLLGSQTLSDASQNTGDKESGMQGKKQTRLQGKTLVYENTTDNSFRSETETELTPSLNSYSSSAGQEKQEVIPSPQTSSSTKELQTLEDAAQGDRGLKRKAIAKGLESLRIPPTFDSPPILSLREWLHVGGQVYSPGSYVTPKFGNYSLPVRPGTVNECSEELIFNPELVAAFEHCMHQLEAEEESILKQIVESSEEDGTEEKQAIEEMLSLRED